MYRSPSFPNAPLLGRKNQLDHLPQSRSLEVCPFQHPGTRKGIGALAQRESTRASRVSLFERQLRLRRRRRSKGVTFFFSFCRKSSAFPDLISQPSHDGASALYASELVIAIALDESRHTLLLISFALDKAAFPFFSMPLRMQDEREREKKERERRNTIRFSYLALAAIRRHGWSARSASH